MNKTERIQSIKQKLQALKTSFVIQAGHPRALPAPKKTYPSLAEVFIDLFSENDESAWLFWNQIPVRFHYTYELYSNVEDLIILLEKLAFEPQGKHEWIWLTDVFITTVQAEWKYPNLVLTSNWKVKRSHQAMADLLNKKNKINTTTQGFLGEWKIILYQIINTLKKAEIVLSDEAEKNKILRLKKIINTIEKQGHLYTPSST